MTMSNSRYSRRQALGLIGAGAASLVVPKPSIAQGSAGRVVVVGGGPWAAPA